jgi:hypothetical protein
LQFTRLVETKISTFIQICWWHSKDKALTLPSAHFAIISTGNSSRWIEVVHIQCGSPSVATTAQKAKMMMRRVQTALAFSGGAVAFTGESDAFDVISFSCDGEAMVGLVLWFSKPRGDGRFLEVRVAVVSRGSRTLGTTFVVVVVLAVWLGEE